MAAQGILSTYFALSKHPKGKEDKNYTQDALNKILLTTFLRRTKIAEISYLENLSVADISEIHSASYTKNISMFYCFLF